MAAGTALRAQVNIGGTLGFTGTGTGLTVSANSTLSSSAGSILAGTGNGITSISGGLTRAAWTKDGTATSYDTQSLTFTNGSSGGSGQTGTFSLTFTPTGGSAITLGTWAFTLDGSSNRFNFSLNNATTGTYSVGGSSFTQIYSSSFDSGSSVINYSVYGTPWSNQTINEGSSSTRTVGFQITNIQPIPEPGTYALAGPLVLFGAMGLRRLRRKSRPAAPAA